MSLRNEEQQLTSEQKKIADQFGLLINAKDADHSLFTFIELLALIPDHVSPLRLLAERNDPLVQHFIDVATARAEADAIAAGVKDRKTFRDDGHRSQFSTNAPDYYPAYFIKLLKPIYENAVYGYAMGGQVADVNKMLAQYKKWFHRDLSVEKREALEKIYKFAFEGYFNGKHYAEVEPLWMQRKGENWLQENAESLFIVARCLAELGKFDLVSELICNWSFFKNNETSLGIIAAVNEGYRVGSHKFELQRVVATQIIMQAVDKTCPLRNKHPRKAKIFELIMKENDKELKKSLLIDCIYKGTVLGAELWYKLDGLFEQTPSLKRGVLEQIFKELIELKVDVATLPGCSEYKISWTGYPSYPSKTHLVGLWPHSDPKKEAPKVDMFADENVDDDSLQEARRTAFIRQAFIRQ